MVEELRSYTPGDLSDLDALMHELSATSYCDELLLSNALDDANVHVYVIRAEGHIVATATLCVRHTLEFTIGDVESVVVSSQCRGLGYGKALMLALIEAARGLGVYHLSLTSHPGRVAANGLYREMGFVRYETNCYRMFLKG
jgi:ribosomal protein S18 acetylase RimI-like enzyme